MAITSDKSHLTTPISIVSRKKSYADLDLSLIKHGVTKDIVPLMDDRAIKNAVKNLILTNFYERPFQPEMGANLIGLLFEPADDITKIELKDGIRDVLSYYEPRINIRRIIVQDDIERNRWRISIHFQIKESGVNSMVNVVLKRLR
jgi:phage baseplate assembly protein W